MAVPPAVRAVALVGHGGSGKTSLADQLLFISGTVQRLGRVDEGTSLSDFDAEARERRHTIDASVLHADFPQVRIQILDCPGFPDFAGHSCGALRAADAALVTVSATAGIQAQTRKVWLAAAREGLARMVVVTKTDAEASDVRAVVDAIRRELGPECVPIHLPDATGPAFKGVASLLSGPEDGASAGEYRTLLVETAVEGDDSLLERYLDGRAIPPEALLAALRSRVASNEVAPIVWTSGASGAGVLELAEAVRVLLPGPGEARRAWRETLPEGKPVAQVFKVVNDPFVGKLAFIRIFSGGVDEGGTVVTVRDGKPHRVGHLLRMQGKEQKPVPGAGTGEIVALAKVEDLHLSDTLVSNGTSVSLPPIAYPEPTFGLAVEAKGAGDEQKVATALHKLMEEDGTLRMARDPRTHETVLKGISPMHLEVALSRLRRRFHVEVNVREPRIPYLETITARAEGHYKHRKQTGGHGQYGEVYLRLEPLPRGAGFAFANEVKGGAIPHNFIPAVEKGVREALAQGALAGFPLDDLKATVYDGSSHDVDSSEAAFKVAAAHALRAGALAAHPVLLEPVMEIEIEAPSAKVGEVTGDLNARRGRILGIDSPGDTTVVRGQVPLAEVQNYATQLRSITGGQGAYAIKPSHHEPVPPHIALQIVQKRKAVPAHAE